MQPAGGIGDKLFRRRIPPIVRAAPCVRARRLDDREVWCVLIDSVQSQANRMEEALLAAAAGDPVARHGRLSRSRTTAAGADHVAGCPAPRIRCHPRDSGRWPFMESEQGRRLAAARRRRQPRCWKSRHRRCCSGLGIARGRRRAGSQVPARAGVGDHRCGYAGRGTSAGPAHRQDGTADGVGAPAAASIRLAYAQGRGVQEPDRLEHRQGSSGQGSQEGAAVGDQPRQYRADRGTPGSYLRVRRAPGVLTLAGLRRLRFGGGKRDAPGERCWPRLAWWRFRAGRERVCATLALRPRV